MSSRPRSFPWPAQWIAGLFIALPAWALPGGLVDLNLANQAELEMVKGVGPQLSERILKERSDGPFASWEDFIARLKGVGPTHAARLSAAGLRVGGQPYAGKAPGREPAK
ncbi:ComEA family DNA-binding protein [Ideonella sp. YS5]|uniref:ComEA family DNA-binding protein n=1 Tax=Ideonella sp. YS5 TaxID=3453714 RepID=UPI003EEB1162